jgi:U2-associated protein SR140
MNTHITWPTITTSGDLYSVKIMWPRTAEERSRNRNTGFVCFMHRKDAEDAMDAYCDADPLETGRRMRLTWGKNVKRTVQFGTGGVPTHFRKKPRRGGRVEGLGMTSAQRSAVMEAEEVKKVHHGLSSGQNSILAEPETIEQRMDAKPVGPIYNPALHAATAIIVNAPRNPRRLRFITTIASFVAKDGSVLEQKLIEQESHNPEFQFLSPKDNGDEEQLAEHIFYRWRVYAFAQGDGFNSWRSTPFVMIQPNGRFWIPPRVDMEEAYREEEAEKRREESRVAAQEERRKMADDKDLSHMTGAQIERATGKDKRGAIKLNDWEKETFHKLLRVQLCATQDSICEAMAFAFDKSGAAIEISDLLKEALLETTNGISVDTRIARLYLLSDILFNSQQPGVRNAFQYRDAIERMSPEVFESLGKHGNGKAGRMTMNRLRNAVSSVLSAWTNWSVYNTNFLDLLECRFEGREYVPPNAQKDGERAGDTHSDEAGPKEERTTDESAAAVSITPRGAWTTSSEPIDNNDVDGQALNDLDGEALDGVPLDEEERTNKPEQSAVSTVPRGQWISADDVDGNIDGEELDEDDIDGESLDDDEVLN